MCYEDEFPTTWHDQLTIFFLILSQKNKQLCCAFIVLFSLMANEMRNGKRYPRSRSLETFYNFQLKLTLFKGSQIVNPSCIDFNDFMNG